MRRSWAIILKSMLRCGDAYAVNALVLLYACLAIIEATFSEAGVVTVAGNVECLWPRLIYLFILYRKGSSS